jgi:hypothetical protein
LLRVYEFIMSGLNVNSRGYIFLRARGVDDGLLAVRELRTPQRDMLYSSNLQSRHLASKITMKSGSVE